MIGLDHDLAGIDALEPRRPLLVFNLVDAVGGDCRLAPMVPARLDAIGLPYTGAGTNAWLDTLSKIGTKLKLARAGLPTPEWSVDGSGLRPDARVIVKPVWEHRLARHRPELGRARRRRRPGHRRTDAALEHRAFR